MTSLKAAASVPERSPCGLVVVVHRLPSGVAIMAGGAAVETGHGQTVIGSRYQAYTGER